MVLHYVANGAGLVVKTSAALYPEVLRHGDFHALDVVAVPEGFDEGVGETEGEEVVNCSLAQVVINAKDVGFIESPKQNLVQLLRRREIVPEGFFDDDARASGTIRFRQVSHNGFEQNWGNRKIVRWAPCSIELSAKSCESLRLLVVAVNIAQQSDQLFESCGIDAAVLLQAVFRPSTQLIEIPAGLGDADNRNVEMPALRHGLQRGENFLVSEVACGAKENERV